jgi:hypothetical protein
MPFTTISIPGISGWHTRPKPGSPQSGTDRNAVPDGFGIPSLHDPDPYGVHALEQAGLEIKEAGTLSRPTSDTFEFKPSPSSPLFRQSFQSLDVASRRGSAAKDSLRETRRDSKRSMVSIDYVTPIANTSSPATSSRLESPKAVQQSPLREEFEAEPSAAGEDVQYHDEAESDKAPSSLEEVDGDDEADSEDSDSDVDGSDDEEFAIIELAEPTAIRTVAQAVNAPVTPTSPTATRAKLVTIPGRAIPAIPLRSPLRSRFPVVSQAGRAQSGFREDISRNTPSQTPTQNTSQRKAFKTRHRLSLALTMRAAEAAPSKASEIDILEEARNTDLPSSDNEASADEPTTRFTHVEEYDELTTRTSTPMFDLVRAGLTPNDSDDEGEDEHRDLYHKSSTNVAHGSSEVVPLGQHNTASNTDMVEARTNQDNASNHRTKTVEYMRPYGTLEPNHGEELTGRNQSLSNIPHNSPGLNSISSADDGHSRIQSSAPTENINDFSSISDYEEELTTNHHAAESTSKSLSTSPAASHILT